MIYVYACEGCHETYDIVKSVKDFEREELCPQSGVTMTRQFAAPKLYFSNTAVQELKWQPALGKAATDRELNATAKAKGWEPIGNEDVKKHVVEPKSEYPEFSNDDISAICRNLK